jgi:fido (protein-threonine AMPylation protein)
VGERCVAFLVALRNGRVAVDTSVNDTRPHHEVMFRDVTPQGCTYFAGHYRGEQFRCLKYCKVGIVADPRVGAPPNRVQSDLNNLSNDALRPGFEALQIGMALPDAQLSGAEKAYYLVTFACRVLVEFLTIHPYVNGNGHIARMMVWFILAKFGYWPKKWPLNGRPENTVPNHYVNLISTYRNGDREPLERFVFECVLGT